MISHFKQVKLQIYDAVKHVLSLASRLAVNWLFWIAFLT